MRGDRELFEVIRGSSKDADLVFLGMRLPAEDESAEDYSKYYEKLLRSTEDFRVTAMVMAGEKVDFRRIFAVQ